MQKETRQAVAKYAELLSEVERTNRSLGKLRTELRQIRDKHADDLAKLRAEMESVLVENRKLRRGMVAWGSKAILLRIAAQHLRMADAKKKRQASARLLKRAKDRSGDANT